MPLILLLFCFSLYIIIFIMAGFVSYMIVNSEIKKKKHFVQFVEIIYSVLEWGTIHPCTQSRIIM